MGSEPVNDSSNPICPWILQELFLYLFGFKSLKSMSQIYIQMSLDAYIVFLNGNVYAKSLR